jgi:hypothetical protein
VVVIHLGASPLAEAAELLVSMLDTASLELATTAISALASSRYRVEVQARVAALIQARGDQRLRAAFTAAFGSGA